MFVNPSIHLVRLWRAFDKKYYTNNCIIMKDMYVFSFLHIFVWILWNAFCTSMHFANCHFVWLLNCKIQLTFHFPERAFSETWLQTEKCITISFLLSAIFFCKFRDLFATQRDLFCLTDVFCHLCDAGTGRWLLKSTKQDKIGFRVWEMGKEEPTDWIALDLWQKSSSRWH